MAKVYKYGIIYVTGGTVYGAIEMLYRGRTHWTMVLAGGACFVLLYQISRKNRLKNWEKYLLGGAAITAVEFITGLIVNRVLDWNVWDYSHQWLNLMGQVCIMFSAVWVLLSMPAMWLCKMMDRRVFEKNVGGD